MAPKYARMQVNGIVSDSLAENNCLYHQ